MPTSSTSRRPKRESKLLVFSRLTTQKVLTPRFSCLFCRDVPEPVVFQVAKDDDAEHIDVADEQMADENV